MVKWKRIYDYAWANTKTINVATSSLRYCKGAKEDWDVEDFTRANKYAALMRRGARFPMMEVEKRQDGKYEIADGNHRLYAIRRLKLDYVPVILFA